MKWIRRVVVALLLVSLVILVTTFLLMRPQVQTWVAGKVTTALSEQIGAVVRIDKVGIRPLTSTTLEGVYIEDLHGDTLVYARYLHTGSLWALIRAGGLSFGKLEMDGGRFALRRYAGEPTSNLTALLQGLKGDKQDTARFEMSIDELHLNDVHFSYHVDTAQAKPFGIDFSHVDGRGIELLAEDLVILGDSVDVELLGLAFREQSGFKVDALRGHASVSSTGILLHDMFLTTPASRMVGDVELRTNDYTDHKEFVEKVYMDLELDSSRIQAADISYFAHGLQGIDLPFTVKGNIRGPVADLKGRDMHVRFGDRSSFQGKFDLAGLPDVQNTFMVIDVEEFSTHVRDLDALPAPPYSKGRTVVIPDEVRPLGAMRFKGNFTGFVNSFTAYGSLRSDAGSVTTDLTYQRDGAQNPAHFTGHVNAYGVQAGAILGNPALGAVDANVELRAQGTDIQDLKAELDGRIDRLTINEVPISGITLSGSLEKDLFNGDLLVNDPRLNIDFRGLADLRGKWPVVDFDSEVHHLDLHALGFLKNEGNSSLSMKVDVDGELAPDSLQGTVDLAEVRYISTVNDTFLIGDVSLRSDQVQGRPEVSLVSTFADATVTGKFLPTRFFAAAQHLLFSALPSLDRQGNGRSGLPQDLTFHVRTKEMQEALDLFMPSLRISQGTIVEGQMNTTSEQLMVKVRSGRLRYKDLELDSVLMDLEHHSQAAVFSIRTREAAISDSTYLEQVLLTGKVYQDDMEVTASWEGSSHGTNGVLAMEGSLNDPHSVDLKLLPSELFLGRGTWHSHDTAYVSIDSNRVAVRDLALVNGMQRIALDGAVSRDTTEALAFNIQELDLQNLNVFVKGARWKGMLNGQGELLAAFSSPELRGELGIDSLSVNDHAIGDLLFDASWDQRRQRIKVDGNIERDGTYSVQFRGKVDPRPDGVIDVKLLFDRFGLAFVNPYLPEGLSDVKGLVTGDVQVDGVLTDPLVSGGLLLDDASLRIDYLNTTYQFSHPIKVYPNMFTMDFAEVTDKEGNTAIVSGTVIHQRFKDFNFDFSAEMDHLLALNTTDADNGLYYGKAYGTGTASISGYDGNLHVEVDARAERGTNISFPLGSPTEVEEIDFITWIGGGDTVSLASDRVDLTGVYMLMDIELDPEANFELIFDPTVGDILSGSGVGNVQLSIDPIGEFKMYGDVEIRRGDYLFTLRNLINKRFTIEPGGRIAWFGDPLEAQLSLNAIYGLRAPLSDIMFDGNESYRKRVPVELVMALSERLSDPGIEFQIRLPTVDESVRTHVRSVISTEQELNEQVFSLLALNRFASPNNYAGPGGGAISASAGTTLSEFASNQLSNWLSRVSDDIDLAVNYRRGDALTQDEVALGVGTQLFNEKLLLNTNVGVQYGGATSNTNSLIGDFSIEYLLSDDGKLRLKAFSQSNDQNLNQADQAQTTQGVGIAYRQEFDAFNEFLQNFLDLFRKKEKRKGGL